MREPTPKQRRQELIEQYVLSRRTMMALMALTCASGLENFIVGETEPPKSQPPDNPTIRVPENYENMGKPLSTSHVPGTLKNG
ncbi:MAG: hypothetical protein AAFW70_23595, partial [Cyanobacteria bacterium J06635_10]